MEHNDIRHRLSEYIEGSVAAEERSAIEEHLKTCTACSDALRELQKTIEHIKTVEEMDPPAWMTQKIMAKVRTEAEEKKGLVQRLFSPLSIKLPIQAVAVLFLAVTAFYIYRSIEPSQNLSEAPAQKSVVKKEAPPASAAKSEQEITRDTSLPAKRVPQSPEYKALDMKMEYEKPAPPVPEGQTTAPVPAPAKPAEQPMPAKKEIAAGKSATAPQAGASTMIQEQATGAAPRTATPAKKREAMPFAGFIAKDEARQESAAKSYQGTWKFTEEEEKLIISHADGRLRGMYYGLELAGEHGRFYYVTEVVNLKIDAEGNISFDIPERELIAEPARTLAEAKEMAKSEDKKVGFSRDVIHMKGSMKNGYLEFECRSDSDSCYDRTMKFKRMD